MILRNPLILLLFLLQSQVFISFCTPVYSIQDLTATDVSFACQASVWTASNMRTSNIYTQCGSTYILGGYNVLGGLLSFTSNTDYYQRIYTDLGTHDTIQFSFSLWAIDNWQTNFLTTSKFQLYFDGTIVNGLTFDNSIFPSQACGSILYKDLQPVKVYGKVTHSGTSLTFRLIHQLTQDSSVASIGFRDLNLQFLTSGTTPIPSSLCGTAPVSFSPGQCTCSSGQYSTTSTSAGCTTCDSSCASCYGSSSSQCFSCKTGYIFNGAQCIKCDPACTFCYGTASNQCTACASGYWLMGSSACVANCPVPLVQDISGSQLKCSSPCSSPTPYLIWDGTCSANCNLPLKTGTLSGVVQTCNFPCAVTEYSYANGTCYDTCEAPLKTRIVNSRRFCDFPCATGQYLAWDRACKNSCDSPLMKRVDSDKKFCYYPCSKTDYLYFNGSCLSFCDSPFVSRTSVGQLYCDYSCTNTGDYLYWDGTCVNTCDFPLTSRIDGSYKFCEYKCTSNQFLYWNGSCSNECQSPLKQKTSNSRKFCNFPCASSEYLYEDGTCLTTCDSPFEKSTIGTVQPRSFCSSPCNNNEYYYAPNKSCITQCNQPAKIDKTSGFQTCEDPCKTSEFFSAGNGGSCISSCDAPLRKQSTDYGNECIGPCDNLSDFYNENSKQCDTKCFNSSGVLVGGGLYLKCTTTLPDDGDADFNKVKIVRFMQYVVFLDIDLPSRLQKLYIKGGRTIFSPRFEVNAPSAIQDKFMTEPGRVFAKQKLTKSFLVNYWAEFFLLVAIIFFAIVLDFVEKGIRKRNWNRVATILNKIKVLIKWNACLVLFAINLDDIILYSYLQFQDLNLKGYTEIISFCVCMLMICLAVAFTSRIYIIVRRISSDYDKITPIIASNPKHLKKRDDENKQNLQFYQVIYKGFRNDKLNQHFFLMYTIRAVLPMLAMCIFSRSTIAQALAYVFINVLALAYIVRKRPIQNKINLIQLILIESMMLIMNLCFFTLTVLSLNGESDSDFADFLTQIVIMTNFIIETLIFVFLGIKIPYYIQIITTNMSLQKIKDKSLWIQLAVIVLQQGGFGFEEIFLYPENPHQQLLNPRSISSATTATLVTEAGGLFAKKRLSEEIRNAFNLKDGEESEKRTSPDFQSSDSARLNIASPRSDSRSLISLASPRIQSPRGEVKPAIGTIIEEEMSGVDYHASPSSRKSSMILGGPRAGRKTRASLLHLDSPRRFQVSSPKTIDLKNIEIDNNMSPTSRFKPSEDYYPVVKLDQDSSFPKFLDPFFPNPEDGGNSPTIKLQVPSEMESPELSREESPIRLKSIMGESEKSRGSGGSSSIPDSPGLKLRSVPPRIDSTFDLEQQQSGSPPMKFRTAENISPRTLDSSESERRISLLMNTPGMLGSQKRDFTKRTSIILQKSSIQEIEEIKIGGTPSIAENISNSKGSLSRLSRDFSPDFKRRMKDRQRSVHNIFGIESIAMPIQDDSEKTSSEGVGGSRGELSPRKGPNNKQRGKSIGLKNLEAIEESANEKDMKPNKHRRSVFSPPSTVGFGGSNDEDGYSKFRKIISKN